MLTIAKCALTAFHIKLYIVAVKTNFLTGTYLSSEIENWTLISTITDMILPPQDDCTRGFFPCFSMFIVYKRRWQVKFFFHYVISFTFPFVILLSLFTVIGHFCCCVNHFIRGWNILKIKVQKILDHKFCTSGSFLCWTLVQRNRENTQLNFLQLLPCYTGKSNKSSILWTCEHCDQDGLLATQFHLNSGR